LLFDLVRHNLNRSESHNLQMNREGAFPYLVGSLNQRSTVVLYLVLILVCTIFLLIEMIHKGFIFFSLPFQ
jgi:hypothetical protein